MKMGIKGYERPSASIPKKTRRQGGTRQGGNPLRRGMECSARGLRIRPIIRSAASTILQENSVNRELINDLPTRKKFPKMRILEKMM